MTSRPTVLIANDQEWWARSLESILAPNGFSVVRAYTGGQALEQARATAPDLIILDAQLPDIHGFEVCRLLRSDPHIGPATPIIITTAGPSGRTQRLEAYEAGAWEFLGQPLDGDALLLKLRTLVTAKLQIDRLREESLVDVGTGLYSMRGLRRRAREIGSDAARRHDPLGCVVFGVDPLQGAAPGDPAAPEFGEAAERLARVMQSATRTSDAVGRLSAAEFAVVAPGAGPEAAVRMADRIAGALEATPVPVGGADRWPRARAGCCAVGDFGESPVDSLELLLRAATALHDLQREGSDERVRSFEAQAFPSPG